MGVRRYGSHTLRLSFRGGGGGLSATLVRHCNALSVARRRSHTLPLSFGGGVPRSAYREPLPSAFFHTGFQGVTPLCHVKPLDFPPSRQLAEPRPSRMISAPATDREAPVRSQRVGPMPSISQSQASEEAI